MNMSFSWQQFEDAAIELSERVSEAGYSGVVAIPRGGLILGVRMAHLLGDLPVLVPSVSRNARTGAYDVHLPEGSVELAGTQLVVDDVVSVGNLLSCVEVAIRSRAHGDVRIEFASLFADRDAISRGRWSAIIPRLYCYKDLNNRDIWVDFAWERRILS